MATTANPFGAFVPDGRFELPGASRGPLSGLTFAAKDNIDVKGRVTSGGNPTRAAEMEPASDHATVVATLLESGASLIGKTVADEFAYGITGTNAHHGTPLNPAAPGCFTGGSSCGSATAVAVGLCDFALGTDTGGSVRIPASYCGIYGFRPTLGRIPTVGVMPLAASFDTVGWLASDVETLGRVGDILLGPDATPSTAGTGLLIATDALAELDPRARSTVRRGLLELCAHVGLTPQPIDLAGPAGDLEALGEVYRTVSGWEGWDTHSRWIEAHPGALGPQAAERFRIASLITREESDDSYELLERYAGWLAETLAGGTLVLLPTTPTTAPRTDSSPRAMTAGRLQTLRVTAAASAGRAPQVSLPLLTANGSPLGVSFIGAPGSDAALLGFARRFAAAVAEVDDA